MNNTSYNKNSQVTLAKIKHKNLRQDKN